MTSIWIVNVEKKTQSSDEPKIKNCTNYKIRYLNQNVGWEKLMEKRQ